MQIKINVRSASRKKAAILQRSCEYPDRAMTVEEFIAETVRQNVREYNERKDAVELLRLFSREQSGEPIEEQLNAVQCFEDGMVALFADGVRYTKKDEPIPLKDQSEVTFVRLVFLAGRMW